MIKGKSSKKKLKKEKRQEQEIRKKSENNEGRLRDKKFLRHKSKDQEAG